MFIERISNKVVDMLVDSKLVDDTEEYRNYYQYGAEITISSVLNVLLILILGLIINRFYAGIMYLFLSAFIKRFTGGYHAKTYYVCNTVGCITFLLIIALCELTNLGMVPSMLIHSLVIVSILVVAFLCPVKNINKPIEKDKILPYKCISIVISLAYVLIGYINRYYHRYTGNLVLYIFILTAVFVAVGKIKSKEEQNEER